MSESVVSEAIFPLRSNRRERVKSSSQYLGVIQEDGENKVFIPSLQASKLRLLIAAVVDELSLQRELKYRHVFNTATAACKQYSNIGGLVSYW